LYLNSTNDVEEKYYADDEDAFDMRKDFIVRDKKGNKWPAGSPEAIAIKSSNGSNKSGLAQLAVTESAEVDESEIEHDMDEPSAEEKADDAEGGESADSTKN
jgi:hypothetical protein